MTLEIVLRKLRHDRLLAAALVIVCISLAAVITLTQKPLYSSTAKLFVSVGGASSATDLSQGGVYAQQIVQSYANVVTTPYVLNPVIQDLHLSQTPAELARSIQVSAPPGTVIIETTANERRPQLAADVVNTIAARLIAAAPSLSPQPNGVDAAVKITSVENGIPAQQPVSPNWIWNLLVGTFGGVMLALLIITLRALLDTKVRDPQTLAEVTPAPVLGVTLFHSAANPQSITMLREPTSPEAEAFRTLRANLQFLGFERTSKTLVVTSSVSNEGKSTTALNLAIALADTEDSVLLVDADLRRPALARRLGIDGSLGLVDVLIGRTTLDQALQSWGQGKLTVLPSGSVPPNPSDLLQSARMTQVLEEMRERFGVVIIDSPPLLPVPDGALLSAAADGALLVVGAGRTTRSQVSQATQVLKRANAETLGSILSMYKLEKGNRQAYYYDAAK